jgi:hypothetical protein
MHSNGTHLAERSRMHDTTLFALPKLLATEAADDARRPSDEETRPDPREIEALDKYDPSTLACTD